jgi:colicin import membrane protein
MSTHRFAPPPERFGAGSMGLALLAHGLLIAALTWGTSWRSQQNVITTASAELWAELPVQAAPPLALQPLVAVEAIPEPPAATTPDIVVEKTKPKLKDKPEPPKKDLKLEATKRKAQEAQIQAERLREQLRQDQIKRMGGLAGASGTPSSTGTAQQSAAPSASYKGFLISLIRPNIVYQNAELERSNFVTDIEFQLASDGSILRPRVAKSSGNKEWDAIALRAIDRTQLIPRDGKGFRPDGLIVIGISPKDK